MNRRSTGFTLIELMVAMAVFTLMVVFLAATVDQMLRLHRASQSETDRLEKAGTALDLMRRDLKGALLPIDPTNQESLQFLVDFGPYQNPNSLFWQAPSGADTTAGDLNIYGYFIRWDAAEKRARLCRVEIEPGDPDYLIDTNPSNWMTADILDRKAPGTYSSNSAESYKGLVAEDVIGLWTRCLDDNGNPMATYSNSRVSPQRLPSAIEVALVVLDSTSAAKLDALPVAPASIDEVEGFVDDLDSGIKSGARIFRTSIQLSNARYQ